MPELALGDVDRHALASEFARVRAPQLMWPEPAPNTGLGGELAELSADGGLRAGTRDRGSHGR
jgi:hypothetical protein